jgi:hypothetical protein
LFALCLFCSGEIECAYEMAWVSLLGIALAVNTLACGGGQETSSKSAEPSSPSAAPSGQKVDTATAGDVKGVVNVDGALPKNDVIKMNADPVCMKEAKGTAASEAYIVSDDGKTLGNVFVYVKDGLGNYVFDTPTESAKIDQKECRYHPHVFGMRVNQPLEIVNSDPDAPQHPRDAEGQLGVQQRPADPGHEDDAHLRQEGSDGPLQVRRARLDERLRRRARPPVLRVTDKSGAFELKSLPPGTYTIEAWHEKLGTQTASVTLGRRNRRT